MEQEQLNHFQKILIQEKETIEKELSNLGSKDPNKIDVEYPETGSNSLEDNAEEISEFHDLVAIEANLQKRLEDTNKALKRIEDKTYGICKYCHKPISEARLEARPTSTSCINCKKTLTQEI